MMRGEGRFSSSGLVVRDDDEKRPLDDGSNCDPHAK
jgi:hypothetical protein